MDNEIKEELNINKNNIHSQKTINSMQISNGLTNEIFKKNSHLRQIFVLLFYGGGILICYLWFGIIQESITKSKYGDTGNDRFTFTQALVFVQCIINALLAYILNGSYKDEVPQKTYAFLSLSYLLAMMASNHALQFISYPTQVLGKSCKPVPIMVFGFLFAGKRYNWKKYVFVLMIVIGVMLFVYKEQSPGKRIRPIFTIGFGEICLLFSLAMDGTTGAIQDNIRRFYKFSGHSMMYSMNLFSSCYLLVALLFTGELFSFLSFIYIYPFVMKNLLILGAVSAMGQYFIFKTISEFGPLTCSIITTTRKLFTMLLSIVIFGNVLNERQYLATLIVFTALFLDAVESKRKRIVAQTNDKNRD